MVATYFMKNRLNECLLDSKNINMININPVMSIASFYVTKYKHFNHLKSGHLSGQLPCWIEKGTPWSGDSTTEEHTTSL